MTQEQILEYNKLCAEFLGWELYKAKYAYHTVYGSFDEWDEPTEVYVKNPTEEFKKHLILSNPEEVGLSWDFKLFDDYYYVSTLKFHSDWNWIMEVVQKCLIGEAEHNPEISNVTIKNIYESLCNTNIEDVLESCVKYIKWYNNHE